MPGAQTYDPASLPDLLPVYYRRLFPFGPYYKWLHYGGVPRHYFTNREFSFTLKDDVYIRYQSFADQQELEKEIQKRCPYKIDIGAVFSHKPKEHKTVKSTAFQAQEKELVFDIDMTDYDEVRNCCSGADICRDCWPLMTVAVKIIDRALREDFGFEHLLWVYSGRRGIHCWVCDETARKLSQNGRTAIAEYLSIVKGGENQTKKVLLDEIIHPSIQHSLDIIEKYFENYALQKQDILKDEERCNKVLALIPDDTTVKKTLEEAFDKLAPTSRERWVVLKQQAKDSLLDPKKSKEHRRWRRVCEEIMLQYVYPRLDVNVSKGVNHLLKSPFCIHPKAGRVCVPMDPEKVDDFDPLKVPTINQLLDELNAAESNTDQVKKIKDYKKTSMKESVEVFERFVEKLQSSWKGKILEQSDMKMEL